MTMTKTREAGAAAKVHLVSDGTRAGTNVFLVITDGEGHELRYKIPSVLGLEFRIDAKLPNRSCAVLMLNLGDVDVEARVDIAPGRATIEDLMAEIAGAKLRADKDPP